MHLAIPHTPRIYARALLVRFQDTCLRSSSRVFAVISRDILGRLASAWCSCFPNSLGIYACVSILVSTHAQLHACLSPTYKFPFFLWYPVDTGCPVKVALRSRIDYAGPLQLTGCSSFGTNPLKNISTKRL